MELVNDKRVLDDANYTVEFKDGKIHTKICNILNGEIQLSKTTISSSNTISTMMYCEGRMYTEQVFRKLFSGTRETFSHANRILILEGNRVQIIL